MPEYSVQLNVENRLCVVVGAGAVGRRKVRGLLAAGARVRLVDPQGASEYAQAPNVEVVARGYREGDLEGAFLAFAATGSRSANAAVVEDARRSGILVNVVDVSSEGDFALPALLRRGDLTVAVSTSGQSPALSAVIRDDLAELLSPELEALVAIAGVARQKLLTVNGQNLYNKKVLREFLHGELPDCVARKDVEAITHILETLFGEGFSLAEIGACLPEREK